ncbi:hypothetical protein NSA56_01440 [Oceanobacillus caeni]|uniref:hypothetical protein n=1 Tax=Oceanobacillus caeni TaxID=405946 RepID=UPI00214A82FB|nr:hypothetical protein [Oceanobacillus caeni]MCR1833059.1 hypothetical protein [Oceanobacillus caeni]
MIPPMRQKVTANVPILDENSNPITDKYGKAKTKPIDSKARVQFKSQLIRDANGQEKRASLEIDLPTNIDAQNGIVVEYTNANGRKVKGTIIAVDEATNLSGSKVYYRTVYVDG